MLLLLLLMMMTTRMMLLMMIIIIIPGLDNPWGSWPTERPPLVGEASANFGG
jgi:hypothetical protein